MISIRKNSCIKELGIIPFYNRELLNISWLTDSKYNPIEYGVNISCNYEAPLHIGVNIYKWTFYLQFFAIKYPFFDETV